MSVTIYHNPRCSKSRATLALLYERGISPVVIEYLNNPPSNHELKRILTLLNMQARDLIRDKEPAFTAAGLNVPGLSDDELVAAIVTTPVLMERPIILANGKAALGRPPENILEIL